MEKQGDGEEMMRQMEERSGRWKTDDQYTHAAVGFWVLYAASVLAFHVWGGAGSRKGGRVFSNCMVQKTTKAKNN